MHLFAGFMTGSAKPHKNSQLAVFRQAGFVFCGLPPNHLTGRPETETAGEGTD